MCILNVWKISLKRKKKKNEWNTYMDKVFTAFDDFTQE